VSERTHAVAILDCTSAEHPTLARHCYYRKVVLDAYGDKITLERGPHGCWEITEQSTKELPDQPGEWFSSEGPRRVHVFRIGAGQGARSGELVYNALNSQGSYNELCGLVSRLPRGGWRRSKHPE